MNQFTASLWRDEAFSAVLSTKSIPEIIKIISRDTSPPLYNLLQYFWFQAFGSSEISIRSLSFSFYLLSLFFVFLTAKLIWNKKTGIFAAILTATNPVYFWFAFEGRMYSLMSLSVVASTYFFVKIIKSTKVSIKTSAGYVIASVCALYTHHFAVFSFLPHVIWFLKYVLQKDRYKSGVLLKNFITIGILYLPWLGPLYNQVKLVNRDFWVEDPTLLKLIELILNYLGANINFNKLAYLPLIAITIILVLKKWREGKEFTFLFLISFFAPIITSFGLSYLITPIFFERYLLFTIPFAMLLVASNTKRISVALVCILAIFYNIAAAYLFTHPLREPFRDLANFVKTHKTASDIVLNQTPVYIWESKYYGLDAPIYVNGQHIPYYFGTALLEEKDIIDKIPEIKPGAKMFIIGDEGSREFPPAKSQTIKTAEVKEFGKLRILILTAR